MNGKNVRPPARTLGTPIRPDLSRGSSEADGVNIIEAQPLPRLWLHITLAFAVPASDPGRVALAAATFIAKLHALDRLLRLTVEPDRCSATDDEALLVFVPRRWGALEAERLDEIKPQVRDLASAAFGGAEVKTVEVVKEHRA